VHVLPQISAPEKCDARVTQILPTLPKLTLLTVSLTSDLTRSFVAMCFIALIPAAKITFWRTEELTVRSLEFAGEVALLAVVAMLSWRRMMRYRHLADVTVFRVYPAVVSERSSDVR
jgi:hypothetical protein